MQCYFICFSAYDIIITQSLLRMHPLSYDEVKTSLEAITNFVISHLSMANSHASDFITAKVWEALDSNIQRELSGLSYEELKQLPLVTHSCAEASHASSRLDERIGRVKLSDGADENECTCSSLHDLCTSARQNTIDSYGLVTDRYGLLKMLNYECRGSFIGAFMNEKKMEEVEVMSSVCAALVKHCSCDLVNI